MTDPRNPNDPDQPGVPPMPPAPPASAASAYPGAPAYGAPTGSSPYGSPYGGNTGAPTGEKKTLSLISMITGIVGVVIAWPTFGFGIILSIAAVVLGFLGKKREPAAKGFWLTGLITGFIGILLALLAIAGLIALIVAAANSSSGSDFNY